MTSMNKTFKNNSGALRAARPTLAALVLALTVAGCATVNTVEPAYPGAQVEKIPDKRIITNSTLNEIAYVVEVDKGSTPSGLAQVQVRLQNMKSGVKNVNYKFEWFDAQGISLNNDPQTHNISLEGGEVKSISDIATSPSAVDWKLSLMESVGYSPDTAGGPSSGAYHH